MTIKPLLFTIALIFMSLLAVAPASAQDDVVWDGNTVQLESRKIAPGVFAVVPTEAHQKVPKGQPAATSGGFVIGKRGVLVIDTMLNARLAGQLIALIRKETSLPIRYLVNTSYHGDHSYGNYVFPQTALVVQHPFTRDYIQNNFDPDRDFMMRHFGKGRGIEEAVRRPADLLVEDQLTVDLGEMEVEIRHFGFAQTEGDLFVWVPKAKAFFTGNPLIAKKPALPWLLDGRHQDSMATMQKIYEFLPEDAHVMPGHGLPLEREDMRFGIDYLRKLDQVVRQAVKEGLSVEQAVARTEKEMEQFKGYALWGWVHAQVNVPAVYKVASEAVSKKN